MSPRPLHLLLATLVAALALAGCTTPEENVNTGDGTTDGDDANAGLCAPLAGESGHEPGTTGSGTGDLTTADGGDPSRPAGATNACTPDGANGGGSAGQGSGNTDGASTGLGEPGGGFSTTEG